MSALSVAAVHNAPAMPKELCEKMPPTTAPISKSVGAAARRFLSAF